MAIVIHEYMDRNLSLGSLRAVVKLEPTDRIEFSRGAVPRLFTGSVTMGVPSVSAIFPNPPYTTVLWEDGTVTVVKCCEGDTYSEAQGFAAALAKRLYGGENQSSSHVKKFVARHVVRKAPKGKKKPSEDSANGEHQ